MDVGEEKALKNISTYGCHILNILEDEEHPSFSYSIGIEKTSSQPELIVAGLKRELSQFIINEYNRRIREGEVFKAGQRASGFLDGFEIEFREVHQSHFKEHFGWGIWLYKGTSFKVLQAVWPTTSGVWPWEQGASEWYLYVQPLLDVPAR
jgi:hypothetical protein